MLLLYHMYGSIEVLMACQFVIGCLSWTEKHDDSLWIDHCAYIFSLLEYRIVVSVCECTRLHGLERNLCSVCVFDA